MRRVIQILALSTITAATALASSITPPAFATGGAAATAVLSVKPSNAQNGLPRTINWGGNTTGWTPDPQNPTLIDVYLTINSTAAGSVGNECPGASYCAVPNQTDYYNQSAGTFKVEAIGTQGRGDETDTKELDIFN